MNNLVKNAPMSSAMTEVGSRAKRLRDLTRALGTVCGVSSHEPRVQRSEGVVVAVYCKPTG